MPRKTAARMYGMKVKGPNYTDKKMTVGDLIHELQAFPKDALAVISVDEEGNQFKYLCNLTSNNFEGTDAEQLPHDLKVGDPYVVIWPHG